MPRKRIYQFLPCSLLDEKHSCDVRVHQGGCCIELARSGEVVNYPKSTTNFSVWIADFNWAIAVQNSEFSGYRFKLLKIVQDFYRNALLRVTVLVRVSSVTGLGFML